MARTRTAWQAFVQGFSQTFGIAPVRREVEDPDESVREALKTIEEATAAVVGVKKVLGSVRTGKAYPDTDLKGLSLLVDMGIGSLGSPFYLMEFVPRTGTARVDIKLGPKSNPIGDYLPYHWSMEMERGGLRDLQLVGLAQIYGPDGFDETPVVWAGIGFPATTLAEYEYRYRRAETRFHNWRIAHRNEDRRNLLERFSTGVDIILKLIEDHDSEYGEAWYVNEELSVPVSTLREFRDAHEKATLRKSGRVLEDHTVRELLDKYFGPYEPDDSQLEFGYRVESPIQNP